MFVLESRLQKTGYTVVTMIDYSESVFFSTQGFISSGHSFFVFSQRSMQWAWNAWLHIPQATFQLGKMSKPTLQSPFSPEFTLA